MRNGKGEEASFCEHQLTFTSLVRNNEAIKKSEGLAQTHGINSAAYKVDGASKFSLLTWLFFVDMNTDDRW